MLIASLVCTVHLAVAPAPDGPMRIGTAPRDFAVPAAHMLADTVGMAVGTDSAGTATIEDSLARSRPDTAIVAGISPAPSDGLPAPAEMITNLPSDWYEWARSTFTVDNLPMIGGMSALTAGMVVTDYESWQPFKKAYERSPLFHRVSDAFAYVGDGKFQFSVAGIFAAYGFLFRDTTAIRTASQTVEVILACGAVVQLLKHLTGRESPFAATTPTGRWALFPNQIEYHKHVPHYDAFPSGHIATALATLTVAMENYPEEKWIGWIGYPVIGMIGIGLVATSIHWWSDIPLGLALGYSYGKIVASRHRTSGADEAGPRLGMSVLSNGTPALALTWRW